MERSYTSAAALAHRTVSPLEEHLRTADYVLRFAFIHILAEGRNRT